MGILRFRDVDDWQRAAMKERQALARDPNDDGTLARRRSAPIAHTATWITRDPTSGQLIYGPEKNIEVYRGYDKELPIDLQRKLGLRAIRGWLFQVRKTGPNPQPDSFTLFEGKEILLSKLPHSRNYFMRRKLKRCKHEKGVWNQVARAWDKHADMPFADERLDRLLQELSVTPFVHSKGCFAAWAVMPKRFDVLGDERFDTVDDYTIAVIDIPFEEAYQWLTLDPAIINALAATEKGCLFDGYQTAEDVRKAVRNGFKPRRAPVRPPITEGLVKNSRKLMEAACWAAMCGREVRDARDSVAQSAVLIYHRFARSFVRREKHPVTRTAQVSEDLENGSRGEWSGLRWSETFAEEQLTRGSTDRWRKLGENAAAQAVAKVIEHVLNAREGQIDEKFIHTIRPALAGWPPGWKHPDGFERAIERLGDRFK